MDTVFYVIAILGCGDGGGGCEQARAAPTRYESAAQCRAAANAVLMANTDLDYPVLRADCRKTVRQARLERRR